MGKRNMFIKIGNSDDNDISSLQVILDFIDHHNNWRGYFEDHEIQKIIDDDIGPGEILDMYIIFDKNNNIYWAYLINGGGSELTELWAKRYFPSIKLYNSSTWPNYKDDWYQWPLLDSSNINQTKVFHY